MSFSIFEELWESAQDVFDEVMGVEFAFQPMREVRNATPIPDPDRDIIASVTGIPVIDGAEMPVGGSIPRSTTMVHFSFEMSEFPQGIQQFDRLQRSEGPNVMMTRLYEVEAAVPDPEAIYRVKVRMKQIPQIGT